MIKRQRITALSAVVIFFIWLLPLGVFIKPSQEKFACGGRRAVCLCSHGQVKSENKATVKLSINSSPRNSNNERNVSSSGSGYFYLAAESHASEAFNSSGLDNPPGFAYRDPFAPSIEHVPKA